MAAGGRFIVAHCWHSYRECSELPDWACDQGRTCHGANL